MRLSVVGRSRVLPAGQGVPDGRMLASLFWFCQSLSVQDLRLRLRRAEWNGSVPTAKNRLAIFFAGWIQLACLFTILNQFRQRCLYAHKPRPG